MYSCPIQVRATQYFAGRRGAAPSRFWAPQSGAKKILGHILRFWRKFSPLQASERGLVQILAPHQRRKSNILAATGRRGQIIESREPVHDTYTVYMSCERTILYYETKPPMRTDRLYRTHARTLTACTTNLRHAEHVNTRDQPADQTELGRASQGAPSFELR